MNALLAIVSTPISAPVIAATRLRRGPTNSAKGAARLVADALVTAGKAGATGQVTVRADSAYYNHDVIAAARTGGARFSITARMDPAVTRAITQIPDDAWVGIKYPHAIYDEDEHRWVSDAEVAEITFTAFTPRRLDERIGARLIVRRVKRLKPKAVPDGQGALFSTWRRRGVLTDSGESMLAAAATHRDHAIVEKVIAELKNGPLAHLPSGQMNAAPSWTWCHCGSCHRCARPGRVCRSRGARKPPLPVLPRALSWSAPSEARPGRSDRPLRTWPD